MSLHFLKKDDPLNKDNCRPVSILLLLSKFFEKLICKELSVAYDFYTFVKQTKAQSYDPYFLMYL